MQQAIRCQKIDLRKIDGERNLADLLTKHSLTREKLMKLVSLFDCEFRGGRADSAPQIRAGSGVKITMADADTMKVEDDETVIPHLRYRDEEMDRLYPRLEAPEDFEEEEEESDEEEWIKGRGRAAVRELEEKTMKEGRRRREKVHRVEEQKCMTIEDLRKLKRRPTQRHPTVGKKSKVDEDDQLTNSTSILLVNFENEPVKGEDVDGLEEKKREVKEEAKDKDDELSPFCTSASSQPWFTLPDEVQNQTHNISRPATTPGDNGNCDCAVSPCRIGCVLLVFAILQEFVLGRGVELRVERSAV